MLALNFTTAKHSKLRLSLMTITQAPLLPYKLSDRYDASEGAVFLSGLQALGRLPLDQLRADRSKGMRTAAFACGYPGSPLATLDREFTRTSRLAEGSGLKFIHQPGQNEELSAAAVAGTQLAAGLPDCLYDGILGFWYGKAPGLDRAKDSLRHGVMAGSSPSGGVVLIVGDDPEAKSSTIPSSSTGGLIDLHVPFLTPGNIAEVLELGRHAVAISRACGTWTALRIVHTIADGNEAVNLAQPEDEPLRPGNYRHEPNGELLPPVCSEIEAELLENRLDLAREYNRLNRLNRVTLDPPRARIAIAAAGNSYLETLETLGILGFPTLKAISEAGIRLAKVAMPYPMDAEFARELGKGVEEVIVVEDKDPHIELNIKNFLYHEKSRPRVLGKHFPDGKTLLPHAGLLDVDAIIGPLRARLSTVLGEDRLAPPPPPERQRIEISAKRTPYFCSGCPHNASTVVPSGSLVGMGIGCHGMVALMEPERVGEIFGLGAMGVEGAIWLGASSFLKREHAIQNLGDGTYSHSGQLAVQFAVATGTNVTFKILYNGAVAMTGGQDPVGIMSVADLAQILLLQGVSKVLITTDDTSRYRRIKLPRGVKVWDRKRLLEAQEHLRSIPGVTVLIHEQFCAAELRRKRKRSQIPTPKERIIINERVCEGCGHCGEVSNCLSLQPIDTDFGRKTKVDQTSCNLDYSCLRGDCPSFASVSPRGPASSLLANLAKSSTNGAEDGTPAQERQRVPSELPEPELLTTPDDASVRMPGIGGTGVVTAAHILGTAAMLNGKSVLGLDQTGLSQKAGPVVSDMRIVSGNKLVSNKAADGTVDLYLVFDLLAASAPSTLSGASAERTLAIVSTTPTSTGAMVSDPEKDYPDIEELKSAINSHTRASENLWVDAGALTRGLFGNTASANIFLIGIAYQAGALPVSSDAVETAIDLNGVAVQQNIAAFRWGRKWFLNAAAVEQAAAEGEGALESSPKPSLPPGLRQLSETLSERTGLGDLLEMLASDLLGYQSEALAAAFLEYLAQAATAEKRLDDHNWELTEAVARNLHKLLAYKDEYEVARLLLAPEATKAAEAVGGAGARVVWHLHPPLLRTLGISRKLKLGRWARPLLLALRACKGLRGTPLDVFGYTALRKLERELPGEYRAAMSAVFASLNSANHSEAVEIARLPEHIRGYEHLKVRRAAEFRTELSRRLRDFQDLAALQDTALAPSEVGLHTVAAS